MTGSGNTNAASTIDSSINSVAKSWKACLRVMWKDTLLRGEDPIKLGNHWAAFLKDELAVADQAKTHQASPPPDKSRDLIAQFSTAHLAMGVGDRKGHDMFVAASFAPTAGDKVVAGVHREPARLLDEAAR